MSMDDRPEETPETKIPEPPTFNLPAVFALRNRLMDLVLDERDGANLVGVELQGMIEALVRAMAHSGEPVDHLTLLHSARYLTGRTMTKSLLMEFAWRVAANTRRLKAGLPAPPWARQADEEWVPLQITAVRPEIQKKPQDKVGRHGRAMRFRVLAGTPSPMEIAQWWSHEKINVMAYALGFKRRPPMIKAHDAELMNFRLLAFIEPRLSQREPGFYHVRCPSSFLTYNRALIKKRRRIQFACPEGYDHQCHECPVGARACEAATHPETYNDLPCSACGRVWWFDTDPRFVNDYCIACQPRINVGLPIKKLDPPKETT